MTQTHVTPGDPVATDVPMGGLDDEQYSHALPFKRLMWPTLMPPSKEVYDVTTLTKGDVWIEVGLSPLSLMPFASGAGTHVCFDERPWTKSMMDAAHISEVLQVFEAFDRRFQTTPNVTVLHEFTRLCEKLDDPRKVGIAFFIITRLGGATRKRQTMSMSIDCSKVRDRNATLMTKHYSLAPQVTIPKSKSALDIIRMVNRILGKDGSGYHLNINRSIGEATTKLARSLTDAGYSWSIMLTEDERNIARNLSQDGWRVDKVGSTYYATRE